MFKGDFVIFQKIYDVLVMAIPMICKMPKDHRFVLGQQLESQLMLLIDRVSEINKLDLVDRKKYLKELNNLLDNIFLRLKLSSDLKLISVKQYVRLMEAMNEIEKLIHNWLKA